MSNAFGGCRGTVSAATAEHLAIAWECLFAYDTLLFALTLARGLSDARERARTRASRSRTRSAQGLVALMTRDGVMYYCIVALANLGNVLTFYIAPPLLKGTLSNFASALSTILCSRLMLNLRTSVVEDWQRVRFDLRFSSETAHAALTGPSHQMEGIELAGLGGPSSSAERSG
jgi:hypothetical protein